MFIVVLCIQCVYRVSTSKTNNVYIKFNTIKWLRWVNRTDFMVIKRDKTSNLLDSVSFTQLVSDLLTQIGKSWKLITAIECILLLSKTAFVIESRDLARHTEIYPQ